MIIGVLMTDTRTNKVSLRGYRILKELPDAPRSEEEPADKEQDAKAKEEIKRRAQKLADNE